MNMNVLQNHLTPNVILSLQNFLGNLIGIILKLILYTVA